MPISRLMLSTVVACVLAFPAVQAGAQQHPLKITLFGQPFFLFWRDGLRPCRPSLRLVPSARSTFGIQYWPRGRRRRLTISLR